MIPNSFAPNLQRFFIILAGCILVVAFLYVAKAILLPLVLAILFTFMLNPVVAVLQRWKFGRVPSALLATGVAFSFLAMLGWLFTTQLADFAQELPKHKNIIVQKITALQGREEGLLGNFYKLFQEIGDEIRKGTKQPEDAMNIVVKDAQGPVDFAWVRVLVGPLLESLIGALLIVVLAILMLINRENLRNRIIQLAGRSRLISTTKVLDDVAHRISRFLFLQTVVNVGFGTALFVGLLLIGSPYAPFFALLAGFLRFVPYVGTSIAAFLLLLCNFAFLPGWSECLLTLALFVLLEILTTYVVEPLLFGRQTGASPVALLVAATFWAWLWGPIGLILSTPLTVSLIVLGKYVPNLAFLNILLGDEPVLAPEVHYYQRLLAKDQDEAIDVVETHVKEHPPETVYDDVLLPTLILAKRDVALDELSENQQQWIYEVVRETLDEFISMERRAASEEHTEGDVPPSSRPVILCAARDEADNLAVRMLHQLLEARGQQVRAFFSATLVGEIQSAVEELDAARVVIVALPAGGLTHTHYLCKRLRARFPRLTILIGRWGLAEKVEQVRERARADGANELFTRLLDTANAVAPTMSPPAPTATSPVSQLVASC